MNPPCNVSGARLTELAIGQLSDSARRPLDEHVAGCAHCTQRLAAVSKGLHALAQAEPPPPNQLRQRRMVANALMATEAPSRRAPLLWSLSLAALALIVGVALYRGPLAPRSDGANALAQLEDGTVLRPTPGTQYQVAPAPEHVIRLTDGEIAIDGRPAAKASPYTIETPLAIVHVASSAVRIASAAYRTIVWVDSGMVEVVRREDGQLVRVSAGESITIEPLPRPTELPDPDPVVAEPEPAPAEPVAEPTVEPVPAEVNLAPPRVSEIRSRIRAGQLPAARALLRRARAAGGAARDDAELAIVEAEIKLAEGHYDSAIAAYLAVTRRHPRAPQAETALFAAAGVALDHPGADANLGARLLKQYLTKYPRGRLRDQATRLLRAVEGSPR